MEAEVKAVRETTEAVRLQVSWGEETALIYAWQIVEERHSKQFLSMPPRSCHSFIILLYCL